MTMTEAVKKYSGVDFSLIKTDEDAFTAANKNGLEPDASFRRGEILNLFFEVYCEDKLIEPTFICEYPIEISPLTKKKPGDPSMFR